MTWDGASGAEGRAPPERSPAAPTAPPRPCRTGVEDVPAPGRRGHRAGSASRGCDEGGHAGRCQEGSVLGDKRRGRLEMCPEFVSLCLSGGHRDGRRRRAPCRAAAHGIGPCSPAAATRLARARCVSSRRAPQDSVAVSMPRRLQRRGCRRPRGGHTCHWNQTSPCTPSRRKVTSCGEQERPGDAVVPFLGELPETGWQC